MDCTACCVPPASFLVEIQCEGRVYSTISCSTCSPTPPGALCVQSRRCRSYQSPSLFVQHRSGFSKCGTATTTFFRFSPQRHPSSSSICACGQPSLALGVSVASGVMPPQSTILWQKPTFYCEINERAEKEKKGICDGSGNDSCSLRVDLVYPDKKGKEERIQTSDLCLYAVYCSVL